MIEHVGHEFMEVFFSCCESVLAEDGVIVLQVQPVSYLISSLILMSWLLTIKAG
jgi:spermidine synthase